MGSSSWMFLEIGRENSSQSWFPNTSGIFPGLKIKSSPCMPGGGVSTRDIHDQLQDLYRIELSVEMVSKITDRILPEIKEWQSRLLNPVYPFIFMDCIHYKVREDGRILSRTAYIVLSVTLDGYKDILSITVGANETSKFWLGMLNDLKNRGVQDVLFFCVDGLPGFKEAIQAVYPQADIPRCGIHLNISITMI